MVDLFKIPLFNLHDLIVITTVIAAFLMMVILTLIPTKNALANRCLVVFFACLFVHSVCILLIWNDQIAPLINPLSNGVIVLIASADLLKGPALLMYVLAITQIDFHIHRQQFIHAAPAIAIPFILLSLNISVDELKGIETTDYKRLIHDCWLLMKGLPAIYACACIPITLSTAGLMQSYYSNDNALSKNWLSVMCIGYAFYWGWAFLTQLFGQALAEFLSSGVADYLGIIENYLAFGLLITLFGYSVSVTQYQLAKALLASRPKSDITPPHPHLTIEPDKTHNKTAQSPTAELVCAITKSMETDKLYLQTNLTAEQFANHIGRSTRDISAVLNQQFEKNFFEFVNGYRVDEAKRLLIAFEHKDTSITDIFYMAGFNSKSAFQRFFKRMTGTSPSEYRQKHSNN
jgi:AraC-like DNA-binding protein